MKQSLPKKVIHQKLNSAFIKPLAITRQSFPLASFDFSELTIFFQILQ